MKGSGAHGSLRPGTVADCCPGPSQEPPGRRLAIRRSRSTSFTNSQNKKTADPVHRSAATSTAASGMPPEPHERDTGIVAWPSLLGCCAAMCLPRLFMWRTDGMLSASPDTTTAMS